MSKKKQRTVYSTEFKTEALALALKTSPTEAASQLGLKPNQIYSWRQAAERRQSVSEREMALNTEVARLKRQLAEQGEELAIVKKAAAYFAKHQR